ncbi:MAG: response regulator, partial [Bryobacterales bacterium]|nr:response regulator [Bryobacterales bacterium]
ASISHELRTPLNGVLGIASVLSSTALDRTQREYVGLIRSSGEILLRTVNEVLDFSRLEAGRRLIAVSPVHLESLAEEVLSILSPVAYQKDLELAWAVDSDVPADILSDETALRQILMNLLGNALKFTDRGSVELRMQRVPVGSGSTLLRITVSDTGPGIPPGQELSIFDPYIRSENAGTQAAVGTGLGLSITKHLVLLLGGTVSVANTPSGGCTFTVELPITPALEPPGFVARNCSSRPLCRHALILTRRAITGEMLARRLEGAGCRTTHLSTAHAALRGADARHPWDLLVIDTALDGGGLEIAQRLKQNQPGSDAVAILLTTGKRETDALNREIPEGYAVYPKPFLPELFCSLLEKASLTTGPSRAADPEISKAPAMPRNSESHPADLLQLQRATQPVEALPPGRAPDGLGCDVCSRNNAKCLAACVAAALPSGGAPRVLIADDNPVNRKVITSMLRSMGIACDAVGNGEEALSNFSTAPYSWIVMDWHMPGMDGLSTIAKIRQQELRDHLPRTPIILCTATNEQDDRLAGWKDTFEEILPKPISLKSLRKALILSARRAPRALAGRGETTHASASPQSVVPPA